MSRLLPLTAAFCLALPLTLAGCGDADPEAGDDDPGKGDVWGAAPALEFFGDFTEKQTGTLVHGEEVVVRYDLARLPGCRGTTNGNPAWTITGYLQAPGQAPQTFEVSRPEGDGRVPVAARVRVPSDPGTSEVALWFTVHNRWGCIEYDSDFGKNYVFPVGAAPEAATITFPLAGAPATAGALHGGAPVRVAYDLGRLPDCRGSQGGAPAWNITGHYRVDAGAVETFEVSRVEGADRVPEAAELFLPAGDDLEMWFEVTNRWGCHAVDDAGGARFHFAL